MKLSNKQTFWFSIAIVIIGFAFLYWGSRIYNAYPGIKEAKHLTWLATKSAGVQYIIAILCIYGGYIYLRINEKK